jgi:hypothetical protein
MNENGIWQRVELTGESDFHMPEDNVGDVELDVIPGDEMSKIENDILLHIDFNIGFLSQDIVDEDKQKAVKCWKTGGI